MDPSSKPSRVGAAATALLAATLVGRPALAAPCSGLPSPIYAIGWSAPVPIFAKVGAALAAASPPQTLVYQSPGACYGVNAIVSIGGNPPTPMTGTANYWDATGKQLSCDLPITGQAADVGVAGTYATYCPGITTLPSGIGEYLGPIQAYDFIVPKASTQTSISAQAAYFVYGFGAQSPNVVSPWNNLADIIKRGPTSGAGIIIALAIGVPVSKLQGTDAMSNGNTITLVASATPAEAAIGFVSGEVADANTSKVNVLAYQHYNQSCGWWPSSTPTSLDKVNVRNGHYALWAPVHFLAAVDASGTPTDAAAKTLIGYFDAKSTTGSTLTTPAPAGVDIDALTVSAGAILDCSMEVQRTTDMGPLLPYAPAAPCGCFFEAKATGTTSCQTCTTDANCPVSATHCRKGYCEVN